MIQLNQMAATACLGMFLSLFSVLDALEGPYSPHPKYRTTAFPHAKTAHVNPPALLWPAGKKSNRFDVQLSRDRKFVKVEHAAARIHRSVFHPHQVLAKGEWFWRYRESGADEWSQIYHFTMADAVVYAPPAMEELKIPRQHPRVLIRHDQKGLLDQVRGSGLEKEILSHGENKLKADVKPFVWPKRDPGLSDTQYNRVCITRAKGYLGRLSLDVTYFCAARLLTSDDRFGVRALDLAMDVMKMDSKLLILNDFTHIKTVNILMMAFDNLQDLMSKAQREALTKRLEHEIEHIYENYVNTLETRIFDNHAWQKTLLVLFKGGIVLKHHVQAADDWLEYAYALWCSRAPASGFNHDGGWFNGTGYFTANMVTLQQFPLLLNWYTGFNFFSHPWYKRSAETLLCHWPIGSYSNGFGDGHGSPTNPRWKQALWMETLAHHSDDPAILGWAEQFKAHPSGRREKGVEVQSKHPSDEEMIEWYALLSKSDKIAAHQESKRFMLSPTTGQVSIRPKNLDSGNHWMVAMRSSPYASGSHTACNQNAFNLMAGGEPLFLSSGYYTNFSDRHNLLHYRHTRGHNTVLVNGMGQSLGTHGYGRLLRQAQGVDWTYVLGDASAAYGGQVIDPMWKKKSKQAGVELTEKNGYGKTPLTRYHRHLLTLDSNTILIIDELEAKTPSAFTWLLHSPLAMSLNAEQVLKVNNKSHQAKVQQWSSAPLKTRVHDQFYEPAVNWVKKKYNGKLVEYKNQYHYEALTEKVKRAQFLTLIQVAERSETLAPVQKRNGYFSGAHWTVEVLDKGGFHAHVKTVDAEFEIDTDKTVLIKNGQRQVLKDIPMMTSY